MSDDPKLFFVDDLRPFFAAVAALMRALAECGSSLPGPVMAAADEVRQATAAMGGRDIGPPPT